MLARVGAKLSVWARRWVPDPFSLALALSALAVVSGIVVATGTAAPGEAVRVVFKGWVDGFTDASLLAFALQICLVLVTGHALAVSPPVRAWVLQLSRWPTSPAAAVALVAFVSCVSALVHWGLGVVVGALLARELGQRARNENLHVHYPLLGAAGYAGLAVWHGGLSGSAPLKVAEPGHFAESVAGVLPVSSTLLQPVNFVVTGGLVLLLPLVFASFAPDPRAVIVAQEIQDTAPPRVRPKRKGGMARFREGAWLGAVVGALGLSSALAFWLLGELQVDLNFINMCFLFLALGAHGSIRGFTDAVAEGAQAAGAIIVQFPLYFGILGIMKATGLVTMLSNAIVAVATAETMPLWAFMSAGLVNLWVPSGGGQWALQGEVLLSAGKELGVDPAMTVMAFSYGDAWTNMLQPFWALPLLGIMGLKARDIMGYTFVAAVVVGLYVGAVLWWFR